VNVCILSGKGGTGKTTVAVNLSVLLNADYFDCDVEEPNGFLFLKPENVVSEESMVDYPVFDRQKCLLCGKCAGVCEFHALANTKQSILLFPELCHGCHACELVCKPGAITYAQRATGRIEKGEAHGNHCARGVLNVGESMAVPVIRKLLGGLPENGNCLLDCAPGTSCNVTAALKFADAAVIVTEPTAFGLHDMLLAAELLETRGIKFGVVVNKSDGKDEIIKSACAERGIPLFGRIPFSRSAAEAYSRGELLANLPEYRASFESIAQSIREAFAWN